MIAFSAVTGEVLAEASLKFQGKSGRPHEIRCVKRDFLLRTLANELPVGTIRYSSKLVAMEMEEDEESSEKTLHLADGSTIKAKVVIGCDGVNSVVAKWLGLPKPIPSGRWAARGMAEYPAGHGFGPTLMQFTGHGFRAGVLPCSDTSVYWGYTWCPSPAPADGDAGAAEASAAETRRHVVATLRAAGSARIPAAALEVIQTGDVALAAGSVTPLRFRSPLSLVFGGGISRGGGVCVAGNALHPMTPELGQGGCAALEDGVVLARCLGEAFGAMARGGHGRDREGRVLVKAALEEYAEARRWRSIQLITGSYVVGFIQQSDNAVVRFVRDRFLAGPLAKMQVAMADYDCGTL